MHASTAEQCAHLGLYTVFQKTSPFSYMTVVSTKVDRFYNIWHTVYWVVTTEWLQHNQFIYPRHLHTFATLPWETIIGYSWKSLPYLCQHARTSFVTTGIKIDGCYYFDVVLMQQMLSSICSIAGDAYVFQQDSAPVHCTRQTVNSLLQTYGE